MVTFCPTVKSLTFSGFMENPINGQQVKVLTSLGKMHQRLKGPLFSVVYFSNFSRGTLPTKKGEKGTWLADLLPLGSIGILRPRETAWSSAASGSSSTAARASSNLDRGFLSIDRGGQLASLPRNEPNEGEKLMLLLFVLFYYYYCYYHYYCYYITIIV